MSYPELLKTQLGPVLTSNQRGKMDVESRMNLSLDDIIKGTRDASKTKKKPKQIGKAKVKLARSAQPVTQVGPGSP